MRLSTSMIFDQQVRGVTNAQSAWLNAGTQLSTGRRVTNPSDDPIAASRAVVLSQTEARDSQFALARSFAKQNLSLNENTLSSVTSAIQSAQTVLISGGNGSLSDADRASYASQLEGIRNQLLNLANSKDGNGRYLFAGYESDKAPFSQDASGKVTYNGGTDAIMQKVDGERTMTVGYTGNTIFDRLTSNAAPEPNNGVSETNLFSMLNDAITALKTPQNNADDATKQAFSDAMAKANRGFSNSLNNVLAVRSDIGSQLDELDKLDQKGDDRAVMLKAQMSTLVDVDYTAAISSYTMQQQALQASYTTFSDMAKMSLFQLNK